MRAQLTPDMAEGMAPESRRRAVEVEVDLALWRGSGEELKSSRAVMELRGTDLGVFRGCERFCDAEGPRRSLSWVRCSNLERSIAWREWHRIGVVVVVVG